MRITVTLRPEKMIFDWQVYMGNDFWPGLIKLIWFWKYHKIHVNKVDKHTYFITKAKFDLHILPGVCSLCPWGYCLLRNTIWGSGAHDPARPSASYIMHTIWPWPINSLTQAWIWRHWILVFWHVISVFCCRPFIRWTTVVRSTCPERCSVAESTCLQSSCWCPLCSDGSL